VRHEIPTLSRRSVLGVLGGTALAVPLAANLSSAHAVVTQERQRVVVIGGGIAGIAAAWLLDGVHDVVLLEAAPTLGGHIRTIDVSAGGRQVPVDAGAQYIGPKSHPVYWKLLTQVLNVPTTPAPMNVTVSKRGVDRPVLVSPDTNRLWPLFDPLNWSALLTMAVFTERAKAVIAARDFTTTVERFINSLPVSRAHRDDLLFPLAAAVAGFSVAQVKLMSAFNVIAFIVRGLGDGFLAPYDYHTPTDGLRSVVRALHGELTTVATHVGAPVTQLSRGDGGYQVRDRSGRTHPADHVVFALSPYAAGPLVGQLPGGAPIASIHSRFTYLPTRIAIHTDPIYMPRNRAYWSGYNVLGDRQFGDPSMWLGTFNGVDLFKSWVHNRQDQPRETIATVDFLHTYETPDYARAQIDLAARQGEERLWYAGVHTTDVASQESGLLSAITIARRLAPTSKNLARLAPPA
jgi:uncharacterized protein